MRNAIVVAGLSLVLAACTSNRTDNRDTNPVNWGNFKCTSQGANAQVYVGWATDESTARRHAQAICTEHSENCLVTGCQNEVADPESMDTAEK